MPIATHKPTVKPQQPVLPTVQPPNYRSTINNDAIVPTAMLLSYIQGAPWTVNYYAQVLGEHSNLKELDPTLPDVYQSYTKTNNFEVRVSTPLSPSYDQDTGITTYSGNGLLYPFMVPNINDYFIADAGDARKGLFRVTSVERKSVHRDSVHYVEYDLVGYVENKLDLVNTLESRLAETYWFDKDRLLENNTPVLREDTYKDLKSLNEHFNTIAQYHYKTFFNRKYFTLVLPGQSKAIYDHYLVEFLLRIIDSSDVPELPAIRATCVDDDPIASQPQLWSMLLQRDFNMLSDLRDVISYVDRKLFVKNPYLQGFFYSGVDFVSYPKLPDTSVVGDTYLIKDASEMSLANIPRITRNMGEIQLNEYKLANRTIQLIPTIDLDVAYVLSRAFYDQTGELSALEILVKDYLKKQTLDSKMLNALCDSFKSWQRLEQFYFGPILLVLIKSAKIESY